MDEVTVYVSTFLEKVKVKIVQALPKDTTFVFIKIRRITFTEYEVPELEDEAVASKIEILFADIPVIAKYRKNLVNLKWAHTAWNGVDILMNSFEKDEPFLKFTLTKSPGSMNASLITEYIIGYIIANERSFFKAKDSQQKSKWEQMIYAHSRGLFSLTIGILGVGEIGQNLAKICKDSGMTVWGLTRKERLPENSCPHVDVYRTPDRLNDLLENCDYICNILPSTPQTRDMLSGDVLKGCRHKKSVFINVGRGDVIDEQSIVAALDNGWLRGAVLDVFRKEPLPASSPLWSHPGVTVTPHVSGWSADASHIDKIMDRFVDNVKRFVEGRPLKGVLDWSQGY
ncbi:glyoxylate/hydroxypyruvate reductase A-like isoform X4 [Mercenaria mercenaria]|uniref:glyoxylate/hydroxypyruvate reductase A-like isoform X4 n=1 Tax=Mercenaria mercenaria TaxID=6596 RepID=UPI00234E8226|nr:glyoxylate/hydroxypyruvate reductase A-like isoform X4 [Mercenaria mercenaria]